MKRKVLTKRDLCSRTATAYEAIGAAPDQSSARVDREAGIIHDVCILGPESFNNEGKLRRKYTAECMMDAAPLYEGAMVNADHPPGHNPNHDREVDKRLGKFRNTHLCSDGRIRGDFIVLKTHPMAERIFEAASNPDLHDVFGFSQVVDYLAEIASAGYESVTKITRVCSVDLVADPATTRSLFESQGPRRNKMDEESTVGTGMEQLPGEAAPPAEGGDDFEGSAFDAVLDEIGRDVQSGKLAVPEAVAKFKLACKLHGPEAKEGGEESKEPEKKPADEPEKAEECRGKECEGEESKGKESKASPCSHEEAMDILEAAKVPVTKIRVVALRALESQTDREALAATWQSPGEVKPAAKPKSGMGKPDSTPAQHGQESKASAWDDPSKAREMLYARN
jgi:hypothetical protein